MILPKEKSEFIIMTADHTKVLVGQGRDHRFEDAEKVFNGKRMKIRTYNSRKMAENLIVVHNMHEYLPDLYNELYPTHMGYKPNKKYRNIKKHTLYNRYTGEPDGTYNTDHGWNEAGLQLIYDELYKHYDIIEMKLSFTSVQNK